jgi:type III pantothenate kinase
LTTLLVDVGNTRLKWRLLDDNADSADGALEHDGLEGSDRARMALSEAWHPLGAPQNLVYASVASDTASAALESVARSLFPQISMSRIRSGATLGAISNGYRDPTRLGVDRLIAMVAARALIPTGALLVIGIGTATTVDLINAEHRFIGGNILPGPAMMTRALYYGTAALPMVQLEPGGSADFATDTQSAISAGVINAQAGAIERLYALARKSHPKLGCVIGGGGGRAVAAYLSFQAELADNLVLDGLEVLAGQKTALRTPAVS